MPTYDKACTQTLTVVQVNTGGRLFEMATSQIIVVNENDIPARPILVESLVPLEESQGVIPKISDTLSPVETLNHNHKPVQCLDFLSFAELLSKNRFSVETLDEPIFSQSCSHESIANCYNRVDALTFIQSISVGGTFTKVANQVLAVTEKRQMANTSYNGVRSDSYYQ